MKINNYEERQMYLNYNIKDNYGSYALITYDNQTKPVWFEKSEELNYDGEYCFQERILNINKIDYNLIGNKVADELEDIIRDKNNKIFNVDKDLFVLPNELDDLTIITKNYLYEWLIIRELKSYIEWEVYKVDHILLDIPINSRVACKKKNDDYAIIGKLTNNDDNYITIEYSDIKENISKVCIENIYLLKKEN